MDVTQEFGTPPAAAPTADAAPRAAWPLAIGLGFALGIFFRWTAPQGPVSLLDNRGIWSPIYVWAAAAGVAILLYLWLARGRPAAGTVVAGPGARDVLWAVLVIAAFVINTHVFAPPRLPTLAILGAIHLPALVWFVIGIVVLGRASTPLGRFAAVLKSVEALVTGGLYAAAAAVFAGITLGLFTVLGVELPEAILSWMMALLLGLLPLLAVASVYEPGLPPADQRFGSGLTRLFFIAARLFLPPTLLVLLVVAAVIPTRFALLASSRETLAVFNVMLFAVMLLLAGATPVRAGEVAPGLGVWLRRGVVAVALLAAVVSAYALVAILSRTVAGGLTANRFTVIGWNVVNVASLAWLLVLQLRARRGDWVPALHAAFGAGLALYGVWTTFVLAALPHIARAAHWPLAPG
jgi:hypothetical protein